MPQGMMSQREAQPTPLDARTNGFRSHKDAANGVVPALGGARHIGESKAGDMAGTIGMTRERTSSLVCAAVSSNESSTSFASSHVCHVACLASFKRQPLNARKRAKFGAVFFVNGSGGSISVRSD